MSFCTIIVALLLVLFVAVEGKRSRHENTLTKYRSIECSFEQRDYKLSVVQSGNVTLPSLLPMPKMILAGNAIAQQWVLILKTKMQIHIDSKFSGNSDNNRFCLFLHVLESEELEVIGENPKIAMISEVHVRHLSFSEKAAIPRHSEYWLSWKQSSGSVNIETYSVPGIEAALATLNQLAFNPVALYSDLFIHDYGAYPWRGWCLVPGEKKLMLRE